MKSFKGELKAIEHSINVNQARTMNGNISLDSFCLSP